MITKTHYTAISVTLLLTLIACAHVPPIREGAEISPQAACKHDQSSIRCVTYQSNYDGDTFRFNMPTDIHPLLAAQSIRLNGVQAGELRGAKACEKRMAIRAKDFVHTTLSSAKRIDLEQLNWAQFCRIGANVIVDGKDLGKILVAEKLALPATKPAPSEADWCVLEKSR